MSPVALNLPGRFLDALILDQEIRDSVFHILLMVRRVRPIYRRRPNVERVPRVDGSFLPARRFLLSRFSRVPDGATHDFVAYFDNGFGERLCFG